MSSDTAKSSSRGNDIDAATDEILAVIFKNRETASDRGLRRFKLNPIFAISLTAAEIRQLAADPRVGSIKLDRLNKAFLDKSIPFIHADSLFQAGIYGYGSLIAVLDTGVDLTHPFYKVYIGHQACFSTTDKTQGLTSFCPGGKANDFSDTAAADCPLAVTGCGHGTHVAGIATGANREQTLHGTGPYAGLVPVKVFSRQSKAKCGKNAKSDCSTAMDSDLIAALEWLYMTRGEITDFPLASINMSIGGGYFTNYCDDSALRPVITLLFKSGVATVIAAGNESKRLGVASPGCIREAITVGAVCNDSDDIAACASYTNMGPQVDVLAPGSDIQSSVVGGGYGDKSGTSMAAPHVAGLIAALNHDNAGPCLSVNATLAALTSTGVKVKDNRSNGKQTRPRIDAAAALAAAQKANGDSHTIDVFGDGQIVFTEGSKKGTYTPASYSYHVRSDCPVNKGATFPKTGKFLKLKSPAPGHIVVTLDVAAANKLPKGFTSDSFRIGNNFYASTNDNQNGAYLVDAFVKRRYAP